MSRDYYMHYLSYIHNNIHNNIVRNSMYGKLLNNSIEEITLDGLYYANNNKVIQIIFRNIFKAVYTNLKILTIKNIELPNPTIINIINKISITIKIII